MTYINFNGKFVEENSTIVGADNRGLKFGDGLFETIKFKKGSLILIDEHLARLWNGLKLLQFELPKLFTPDYIEEQILLLIKKNKLTEARVRLTIIRGNGGIHDPKNLAPQFIIQTWSIPETNGQFNENGLQLLIYKDCLKSIDSFSNCKHNNFLPYLMGALVAKKEKCNDALIFNSNHNICDTTIANIFIIKDQVIYTPKLSDGCIAGVMRQFVINELLKNEYTIIEKSLDEDFLLNADEVFLTNSMYNIRWVAGVKEKTFTNQITKQIYNLLNKTNQAVFC